MKLGSLSMIPNQTTEFRVAHFPVTSTKEGPNEQIKSEIHAHHFFLFKGNCSQGVCATQTDCESNVLCTGTRAFEKDLCASAVKLQTCGSFTTIMHQVTHHSLWGNFWLNIISRFPTHHTALTWLHAISFYSPKLKTHLKGHHFGTVENVQAATMRALNNISSEDLLHCYEEWQQCWNNCIWSQGAYFEVDKL